MIQTVQLIVLEACITLMLLKLPIYQVAHVGVAGRQLVASSGTHKERWIDVTLPVNRNDLVAKGGCCLLRTLSGAGAVSFALKHLLVRRLLACVRPANGAARILEHTIGLLAMRDPGFLGFSCAAKPGIFSLTSTVFEKRFDEHHRTGWSRTCGGVTGPRRDMGRCGAVNSVQFLQKFAAM